MALMLKLRDPQTLISDMLEIMTAIFATQIEIDSSGVAWLAGTKVKVVEVVLDKLAHGGARKRFIISIRTCLWHKFMAH